MMKGTGKRCATALNILWSSRYGRIWLALAPALAMCYGSILLVYHSEYLIQAIDTLDLPPFYMADVQCDHCSNFTYSFTINHKDSALCTNKSVFLLFLVTSAPQNTAARTAIRKTWGNLTQYRGYHIKTIFVTARSSEKAKNDRLARENDVFNDLIQIDMVDSYEALTNKTMAALYWAVHHCPMAKFLVKTDDDSLNLPHRYVDHLIASLDYYDIDLVAGEMASGHFPTRNNKWKVPYEEYPDKYYPPHFKGRAYIVSRSAARKLLDAAPNVMFNRMEDVYVTGLCRVQAGIPYTTLTDYGMPHNDLALQDCNLATNILNAHYVKPDKMHELYFSKALNSTLRRQCFYSQMWSNGTVSSTVQVVLMVLFLVVCIVLYKKHRNTKETMDCATSPSSSAITSKTNTSC